MLCSRNSSCVLAYLPFPQMEYQKCVLKGRDLIILIIFTPSKSDLGEMAFLKIQVHGGAKYNDY